MPASTQPRHLFLILIVAHSSSCLTLYTQQVFQRFDVQRGYAIGTILIFTTLLTLAVLGGGVQLVRRRLR